MLLAARTMMDLQPRQVAHFGDHGVGGGQCGADLAQAFAPAAVHINFSVIVFAFAHHWRYAGQLVAQVPGQGLATLQKLQVAVGVEMTDEIRWLIALKQAAVAVRGHGPSAGKRLSTEMPQFDHVARRVVVVFFAVVDHGIRVGRGVVRREGIKG